MTSLKHTTWAFSDLLSRSGSRWLDPRIAGVVCCGRPARPSRRTTRIEQRRPFSSSTTLDPALISKEVLRPSSAHLISSSSRSRSSLPSAGGGRPRGPSFMVSRVTYHDGRIQTLNFDTTDLMKRANIYARDLFFTLNLTSRQERMQTRNKPPKNMRRRPVSAIETRQNQIILSFGNVRAVVTLNDVLLFDAHNPAVKDFARELSETFRLSSKSDGESNILLGDKEPNELVFLESVLRDTVESYNRRLRLFEPIVDSLLEKVDNHDITSPDAIVHQLAPLKDALQSFEIQLKQSQECLEDLLNHDDEMLDLLLTEQRLAKTQNATVEFARHEHVEVLLGVYAREIGNINMEIAHLLQRLQSKQEFVALALSGYRNRMIRMNVHLGIATLSLGLSTAVAGFFGMNLLHGLESSPTAFGTVVLCSSLGSVLVSVGCLNLLSGRVMRERASQRLDQMETLTNALSDMSALDHTLKSTVEKGVAVSKDEFRSMLRRARESGKASSKEIDLLFEVFDRIKDGNLTPEDFQSIPSTKAQGTGYPAKASNGK